MRSGRGTKQLTGEVHPLLLLLLLLLLLHPTQLRSTWVTALVPAKGFTWEVGKEEESFKISRVCIEPEDCAENCGRGRLVI